ncbi:MAG: hypothetical protein ACT4OI_09305, partial [Methanobacteriota archaeon]
MSGESAFDAVSFLGTARSARRDPYRLALFARHLEPGERPLCLLPVQGGTILATDRRLLELRAHLDVHGAWNVKEFLGYEIHREIPRVSIRDIARSVVQPAAGSGARAVEDSLVVITSTSTETF